MNGLSVVNIELTSRCNKVCHMCGRRKIEREHPELAKWGDMDYGLVKEIASQVPTGIVIQFHNNGEPLLYPHLQEALHLFPNNIRCFDTNGKILAEKANEIIGNLEVLTLSVIPKPPRMPHETDEMYQAAMNYWTIESVNQRDQLFKFLIKKGDEKPMMVYRLLGDIDEMYWKKFPGIICKRTLHSPMGSYNYQTRRVIPEIGICLDLLNHMAIDRYGNVSHCVRFDPKGEAIIGHVKDGLEKCWNGAKRKKVLKAHIDGKRESIPFCAKCHYWGVPG